jgi:hypothetical protein
MIGESTSSRVLRYLLVNGPSTASIIGATVWRDVVRHGPIYARSNGGGDYAMQCLLGKLRKKDLVRVVHDDGRTSRWEITVEGRKLLQ